MSEPCPRCAGVGTVPSPDPVGWMICPVCEPEQDWLFRILKVKNRKDAEQAVRGLQERVRYTEDFEALRFRLSKIRRLPVAADDHGRYLDASDVEEILGEETYG